MAMVRFTSSHSQKDKRIVIKYSRHSKIYWLVTEQNISGNMVTVMSPDGKPIQVNASALQSAGSQNNIGMIQLGKKCHNQIDLKQNCQYVKRKVLKWKGCRLFLDYLAAYKYRKSYMLLSYILILGNTVTVMSPDGTPVQVNNSALQEAVAQGSAGMPKQIDSEIEIV